MAWTIEIAQSAERALARLDPTNADRIRHYLRERVAGSDNPRGLGKALVGELGGLWRYRVGNYRILCQIKDAEVVVLVVKIDHRRKIYR